MPLSSSAKRNTPICLNIAKSSEARRLAARGRVKEKRAACSTKICFNNYVYPRANIIDSRWMAWPSINFMLLRHVVIEDDDSLQQPSMWPRDVSVISDLSCIFVRVPPSSYVNNANVINIVALLCKKSPTSPHIHNTQTRKHSRASSSRNNSCWRMQFHGSKGNYSNAWCFMKAPKHFQFYT